MKRRPVAAILTPVGGQGVVAPEPLGGALRALAEARPLDLSLFWPYTVGLFAPPRARSEMGLPIASVPCVPWPSGLGAAAALRLATGWLAQPRASRPQVLHGIGDTGAVAAVRSARALGVRSAVWCGSFAGLLRPETMVEAHDVWALDDDAARVAVRAGVRAFRVPLAAASKSFPLGPPSDGPGRLCVLTHDSALETSVVRGLARVARGLQVTIVGPAIPDLEAEWPDAQVRFVDPLNVKARRAALAWSSGVWAPSPEPVHAHLVEALLTGRPILVPEHRKPPYFDLRIGFSYAPTKAESLADALSELWAAVERKRFSVSELRAVGEAESLERYAPTLVARTLALAACEPSQA